MILDRLLGDYPLNRFLDEYYLRRCFGGRAGCKHIIPIGVRDLIERSVAERGCSSGSNSLKGPLPHSAESIRVALADGCTLVPHAGFCNDGLDRLFDAFQNDLAAYTDSRIHWTAGGQKAFAWHEDPTDVFSLQIHGRKEWQLRTGDVGPLMLPEGTTGPTDDGDTNGRAYRYVLHPGDWLYIPAGCEHSTFAVDECISITIDIHCTMACGEDHNLIYHTLRDHLIALLAWRCRERHRSSSISTPVDDLIYSYQEALYRLMPPLGATFKTDELVRSVLGEPCRPLSVLAESEWWEAEE